MKNNKFSLLVLSLLCLVLTLALSGCSKKGQDLDGLYIVEFQLNGGLLDKGSTLVDGKVSHAYEPDSLAIDISKFENYSLQKNGFVFEGWYSDEALTDKWDFATDRVSKDCTLYARWDEAVVYSYSVILVDQDGGKTTLGQYTVKEGASFSDNTKKYTTKVLQEQYGKTCIGLYSDESLESIWNTDYKHPGGEADTDIPVYIKAIEGVWTLVENYDDLSSVAGKDKNIYLLNDIDCQGEELYFRDYNSSFNGNGFKISNVTVRAAGTTSPTRNYSLFDALGAESKIYDITFENIKLAIDVFGTQELAVSALAQKAEEGFEISNVTVTGTYTVTERAQTALDNAKATLNQALVDSTNQTAENVKNFTALIELEDNNQQ